MKQPTSEPCFSSPFRSDELFSCCDCTIPGVENGCDPALFRNSRDIELPSEPIVKLEDKLLDMNPDTRVKTRLLEIDRVGKVLEEFKI
jgi:hypothetical protein